MVQTCAHGHMRDKLVRLRESCQELSAHHHSRVAVAALWRARAFVRRERGCVHGVHHLLRVCSHVPRSRVEKSSFFQIRLLGRKEAKSQKCRKAGLELSLDTPSHANSETASKQ